MRFFACALAAMAALQSQPTFRSGVELIRIDVSVLDKAGKPVTGLQPEDFVVTIDGTPRRVSFATFYGPDPGAPAAAPAASLPPNVGTNRNAAPGRVVVFVVDLESMTPGYERVLLETASTLIDRLGPRDAVGLLPIPGKGVEITRDRARVREALKGLRGFGTMTFQTHVISMREARAFEVRDSRVISEVVERECARYEPACPMQLRDESRQLLFEARRRMLSVLTTLSTLNARLQPIQAPKTLVVLSAGLPFEQESLSHFQDLQKRTAESGTSTHVVQLHQPETDASDRRTAGARGLPERDLFEGLSTIAGVTGGSMSSGVGRAVGVFDRIAAEVTHSWQLGVEAAAQDSDGKTHQIQVKLRRPGLTLRARRELILPTTRTRPTAIDLLAQPVDVLDLPISAAGYTARGEEATTLKEILVIELPRGAVTEPAAGYALAISKDDRVVFQTDGGIRAAEGTEPRAVTGAQLPPGVYRLRLAVVDAAGRPGTLEMPLAVGLRPMGALQGSDLFLGTAGDRFTPAIEVAGGAALTAILEIYAADPAAFDGVAVELEVRRTGDDPVLASAPAAIAPTELPGRRIASGSIPVTALQPGSYTVSAMVRANGQIVGKVSRAIALTR
jgi:VWFA-related protein